MTTPSPERPEPQWMPLKDGEIIQDGDQSKLENEGEEMWQETGCSGDKVGWDKEVTDAPYLLYRRRIATRTAPEPVVGERKKRCGCTSQNTDYSCPIHGDGDGIIATPPLESDKDADAEECDLCKQLTEERDGALHRDAVSQGLLRAASTTINRLTNEVEAARTRIAEQDEEIARLRKFQDDMQSTGAIKLPDLVPISYAELVTKLAEQDGLIKDLEWWSEHGRTVDRKSPDRWVVTFNHPAGSQYFLRVEGRTFYEAISNAALAHAAEAMKQP